MDRASVHGRGHGRSCSSCDDRAMIPRHGQRDDTDSPVPSYSVSPEAESLSRWTLSDLLHVQYEDDYMRARGVRDNRERKYNAAARVNMKGNRV